MEAIPKSDIKSVIKSDIRFDISIKQTTWIGHYRRKPPWASNLCKNYFNNIDYFTYKQ